MGKGTELKLVGQPILGQVLKLVDRNEFDNLVKRKKSDRYYKAFKSWIRHLRAGRTLQRSCLGY